MHRKNEVKVINVKNGKKKIEFRHSQYSTFEFYS